MSQRGFAGGADKEAINPDTTDFDILFVGKFENLSHSYHDLCGLIKKIETHMDICYRWRRSCWAFEDYSGA